MRRILLTAILTVVTTATLLTGIAAAEKDPPSDSVIGQGTYLAGITAERGFYIQAFSDPLGQDAYGYAELGSTPTQPGLIRGPVTCLFTAGKTATIGGRLIVPIQISGITYTHYSFQVVDTSPAVPGPDLISSPIIWGNILTPELEATFCRGHWVPATRPVTSGGLTVTDAVCDKKLDVKKDGELKCKENKNSAAPAPTAAFSTTMVDH